MRSTLSNEEMITLMTVNFEMIIHDEIRVQHIITIQDMDLLLEGEYF